MTNRKSQQTPSAEVATGGGSVASAAGIFVVRFFSSKPIQAYTLAGALCLLTALGWTQADGGKWPFKWPPAAEATEQSVLPPGKWWIITIDMSEKDPAKQIQRKEVDFDPGARVQHGKYRYIGGDTGDGRLSMVKRLGETLEISFWSETAEGPGVGALFLRPIDYREGSVGRVWTGFEVGHECECAPGIARPGPFTSVPAILSSTPNPPEKLIVLARKRATVNEVHFFPDDYVDELKKMDPQAAAKGS
jgi:hypothetical protein